MKLRFHVFLFCFYSCLLTLSYAITISDTKEEDPCIPNQVHVSLGDAYYNTLSNETNRKDEDNSNSSVFVTWQTKNLCDNTYVSVSSNSNFSIDIPSSDIWYELINTTIDAFHNEGKDGSYKSYSHTAMLKGLNPRTNYTYQVLKTDGSNSAGPFTLNLPHLTPAREKTKFLIYADIDTSFDNVTVNSLNSLAQANPLAFDFQLFLGDLGYNIYTENGKRGEYFFNTAQPFLATWPFMMTAGNHEAYQNYTFLNFRNRMPLYNKTNNHYYSFNVGKMHLVGINYYFYDDNPSLRDTMYQWLEEDLKAADADRKNRPWIIVYSHQPIYCSYSNMIDPDNKRCYFFAGKNKHWEDLYHKYKVDIVLQGHVHYWERTGPVYRNQSASYASWSEETRNNSIINAQAPIYTIEGSAGNSYFMISNPSPLADYSIKYDLNLGYSTLSVVNDSALYYEHVKSGDGSMIDYFYLLKGPIYPTVDEYNPGGKVFSHDSLVWVIVGCILASLLVGYVGLKIYREKKKREEDVYKALTKDESGTEILKV